MHLFMHERFHVNPRAVRSVCKNISAFYLMLFIFQECNRESEKEHVDESVNKKKSACLHVYKSWRRAENDFSTVELFSCRYRCELEQGRCKTWSTLFFVGEAL